jgi:Polyketide cyclase / dehydrase and lipid transport
MKVAEPEPGRVLTESDTGSSAVTTFTVSPRGGASVVQISAAWDGAGGIGGLFERMFAPRVLRAIYADELERLDAYAREHRPT